MSERTFAIGLACALLMTATALPSAAQTQAGPPAWPEEAYNPVVQSGDLVLPMPCGGAMTFRPVAVVGNRPFDDQQIGLGSAEEKTGYLGGPRLDYIGAAFPDPANSNRRFFYIGKYEVSAAQAMAFGTPCSPLDAAGLLPATDLSWFDAVAFANRYSEWLLANARHVLPQADGVPAFTRLPTEAEWEYAARGGIMVDQVAFSARRFPMPGAVPGSEGEPADYLWHQGSESANNALHPIGSLKPNPLGIHDILGNAAEMVLEPFRLNRRGRPHGQAGGMILRGGDFTVPVQQQRTAWRLEVPLYDPATGLASRQNRFGFRLVLAAPTVAAAWPMERVEELNAAWAQLPVTNDSENADAREKRALEDIARAALVSESATLRSQLTVALSDIENSRAERNDARDRLVRSLIRNGAISAEQVSIEERRFNLQKTAFEKAEAWFQESQKNLSVIERKGSRAQIEESQRQMTEITGQREARMAALNSARSQLQKALIRYGDLVIELAKENGIDLLRRQSELLKAELESRDHRDLIAATDLFVRHVDGFQRLGPPKQDEWLNAIVQTFSSRL
ncbi:hypothetical protein [Azospirillum palustre]